MEEKIPLNGWQTDLLELMIALAVVLVLVPFIIFIIKSVVKYFYKDVIEKSGMGKTLLRVSVYALLSVFLLRYSVGLYKAFTTSYELSWWEEISNSIIHALQTFSMDEEYTNYIVEGKEMAKELWGEASVQLSLYSAFVIVMNLVAPIAGGAMLLEILTSLFPNVRLSTVFVFAIFNNKYYFSKLNERSLSLAESIVTAYRKKRKLFGLSPIIIFCDVYADNESEKESELLAGAKAIGAICVRDDLIHIRKNPFKHRTFVLIDDDNNEINNLKLFASLADEKNANKLKYSEVFLFSQSDMHTVVEAQVYKRLKEDYHFEDYQLPTVTPVKCYKNLVNNLLADLPLYESLVEDKRKGNKLTLNVSILGGGVTGKEMLMSVYWFGQILDCELNINVFSQETEKKFYDNLNYVNPEINESTKENNEVLRTGSKTPGKPYCKINYTESRVDTASFFDMNGTGATCLASDYVFVALGSDETNIEVANKLREEVGKYHLRKGCPTKTIITYVVYNSDLCDALNGENSFDYSLADNKPDIYMRAVGSLKSVYSIENVFCGNYMSWAVNTGELYDLVADRKGRKKEFENKRKKDDYSIWADRARAMHVKYKIFSAGFITTSVFDTGSVDAPAYKKAFAEAYLKFNELAASGVDNLELLQRLAWLEHRRWIAFLRTKGFRSTDKYPEYMVKNYKPLLEEYKEKEAFADSVTLRTALETSRGMKLNMRIPYIFFALRRKHCRSEYKRIDTRIKKLKEKREENKVDKPSRTELRLEKKKSKLSIFVMNAPKPEHKHIPLKLHPCIVETAVIDPDVTVEALKKYAKDTSCGGIEALYNGLWAENKDRCRDLLDEVSREVSRVKAELKGQKEYTVGDYKQYDYPCYDVDEKTVEAMKELLKALEP